jgi:hypothetical protein
MNIKAKRDANLMSADDVLSNLQGRWKCMYNPHFLLHIEGENILVNEEVPQKITLERFDTSWSFYLNVLITNVEDPTLSLKIDRVIIERFDNPVFGKKKISFSTIYPANAKTFKDMDFHDNTLFRFESI